MLELGSPGIESSTFFLSSMMLQPLVAAIFPESKARDRQTDGCRPGHHRHMAARRLIASKVPVTCQHSQRDLLATQKTNPAHRKR